MNSIRIDLISDTATKPTKAMRQAMADAEVGDEQLHEDPTVNALCERVATLLGKQSALFLPSGTMCNQIAILCHCRPGDEIIADETAHIIAYEGAGAATLAGALIRSIPSPRGIFTAADVKAAIRPLGHKSPRSRLVVVEQTSNAGGGSVWPLETIGEISDVARENDLATHMDGARLLNAVVATGVSAESYSNPFDSVWLDLSKGLGCPFGGVLAGSEEFIEAAWGHKHRLGGAMRQAGIMAAAGLYSLDHHVDRLAEDHANAQFFARRLAEGKGLQIIGEPVETNLVFIDVRGTGHTAGEIAHRLGQRGVRIDVESPSILRAVTHLDVSRSMVEEAADIFLEVISSHETRL